MHPKYQDTDAMPRIRDSGEQSKAQRVVMSPASAQKPAQCNPRPPLDLHGQNKEFDIDG